MFGLGAISILFILGCRLVMDQLTVFRFLKPNCNILDFKVWRNRVGGLILNFYPSAEVVNDVEKGAKLQICFETSLSELPKAIQTFPHFISSFGNFR